jgi:quaternary ammonium compound-resistance protein SugE
VLLARATAVLPIGTAYAVWVAIGVVGAVLLEAVFFGHPLSAARAVCLGLLLSGVVGLKLLS